MKTSDKYAAAKVPAQITAMFWGLKLLTTGMGEAMSDFMGDHSVPIAGAVGVLGLALALWLQLRQSRYWAPCYWFVVMMIAIFGTMTADAIHDGLSIPYPLTTAGFGLITAAIFFTWYRTEGTLSIHSIDTRRRELYYWAAVYATFAFGTAAGDMTAASLNLGYGHSILLFAAIILIPAIGWWRFGMNWIAAFWFAYKPPTSPTRSPTSSPGRSVLRSPIGSANRRRPRASDSAMAPSAASRSSCSSRS